MAEYAYRLEPDDNGTFLITVPTLPEVTSFADTAEEAPLRARQAIEEALAARMAEADAPIPSDPSLEGDGVARLPVLTGLKVSLFNALKASGSNRAALSRTLGWNRTSVDRLFDLNHHSKTEQIEAALAALGQGVTVSVHPLGESRSFASERPREASPLVGSRKAPVKRVKAAQPPEKRPATPPRKPKGYTVNDEPIY